VVGGYIGSEGLRLMPDLLVVILMLLCWFTLL